jgi:hypothetical protein
MVVFRVIGARHPHSERTEYILLQEQDLLLILLSFLALKKGCFSSFSPGPALHSGALKRVISYWPGHFSLPSSTYGSDLPVTLA